MYRSMSHFRHTLLHLPPRDLITTTIPNRDNDHNRSSTSVPTGPNVIVNDKGNVSQTKLVLPINRSDSKTIDEYVADGYFPSLYHVNEMLWNTPPIILLQNSDADTVGCIIDTHPTETTTTNEVNSSLYRSSNILYVAQGEIAHCTPQQTDIIVSDRATTCHILALRSYRSYRNNNNAFDSSKENNIAQELCTMAHIDCCYYEQCIRDAFYTHYVYHCNNQYDNTCDLKSNNVHEPYIAIDIHIVGGFNDKDNTSRTMTIWIMELIAKLADEYHINTEKQMCMVMTLRTACITAANHDKRGGGPIIRGLAMDCQTGTIFAARCMYPSPAITLRMSMTWIRSHNINSCDPVTSSKLSIIHTHHHNKLEVRTLFPDGVHECYCGFIQYEMRRQFELLLQITHDPTLLKYCSTSPEYEEEDFCTSTRASFRYILQQYNSPRIKESSSILQFQRLASNTWKLLDNDNARQAS